MATNNDARVITLRTQIESRRNALKSRPAKFVPVTNCSLELDGVRYNLHTLDTPQLIFVGSKLQALIDGATKLFMTDAGLVIGGFKASDWIEDVKGRMEAVSVKTAEAELRVLDAKLKELLSTDAKTNMALDEIEALLV